jgi:hypothetical protein
MARGGRRALLAVLARHIPRLRPNHEVDRDRAFHDGFAKAWCERAWTLDFPAASTSRLSPAKRLCSMYIKMYRSSACLRPSAIPGGD